MSTPRSDTEELILFMSADVVGSTAFKTKAVDEHGRAAWLEAFETLFRELPLIFIGKMAAHFFDADDLPESGVWKVMGDEVLFVALPTSLDDAQRVTAAFCEAVHDYDQRIHQRWPLRIRGCCWGAQIGDRNRKIEIPEMFGGTDGRPYLDFLGPDIDLGFRLSSHSGPGETIVSPNLVESFAGADEQRGLRFHYLGEKALKGVCGGQPFPLVLASSEAIGATRRSIEVPAELAKRLGELRNEMQEQHGMTMASPVFGGSR